MDIYIVALKVSRWHIQSVVAQSFKTLTGAKQARNDYWNNGGDRGAKIFKVDQWDEVME